MNYIKKENNYVANEGYVFESKKSGFTYKAIELGVDDTIDNYNVILEPIVEEPKEEYVPTYEELLEVYNKGKENM